MLFDALYVDQPGRVDEAHRPFRDGRERVLARGFADLAQDLQRAGQFSGTRGDIRDRTFAYRCAVDLIDCPLRGLVAGRPSVVRVADN